MAACEHGRDLAELGRLREQLEAVRRETLLEAAKEMHREARWQEEQSRRVGGREVHGYARDRALELESVFKALSNFGPPPGVSALEAK